jgi:hypothetical protein
VTQKGIENTKARTEGYKKRESKVKCGHYVTSAARQLISEENKFLYLSEENLKAETEM